MADPQTVDQTSQPSGSLPASLINPEDMSYFAQPKSLLTTPLVSPTQTASLPPPTPSPEPAPAPAPTPAQPAAVQPQPSLPPATTPAVAPPTPLQPPPAAAPAAPAPQQPQHPPTYVAVGDSLAAGIAQARKFNERYDVADNPASKADPSIMAASGRTTAQTLATINANPQQFAGQDVLLSTGMSNDLMGGGKLDDAMTNVASQLDALRKAGANVALAGVGSGVPGYQQANARLAQIAKAYNVPFTGEPSTTQGGRVHPSDYNAFYGQFHFGGQQPTPGTGKTIDDATAYIQQREGGGPFILYGHEGQPYDPKSMPTKPPNAKGSFYGFPDWAGGYGPDGRQTHAAGGAQWEPDTWQDAVNGYIQSGAANQLGHTPDFRNPADQKAVFNYWAARRYREQTGRDIVADMNAGHVDWASLGSEWSSLKYAGTGGVAGMTASNLPGYQNWQRSMEDQRRTLEEESADLQKRMNDLEAGDPQQRALADQLLKKQIQLMDHYEQMIAHPPTQKPHDAIGNFGSIATLIGIFAGRFAHRPMVASLNAAGAAMQAMNDNDYEAYQNAFKTWKTQSDMTSNLISMESNTYKGIMEDKRMTMEEKFKEMDAAAKIYQNRLLSQQLEAGEYEKAWEYAQKLDDAKEKKALNDAQIEELHAKVEKERADAQWGTLIPAGEEGAAIKTKLAEQAAEAAKDAKPGETPPTPQQLAQNPAAVDAARKAVEADKKGASAKYPLVGGGEEGAAIMTELTAQAEQEKANPPAGGARTVDQLAQDGTAVSAARAKVEAQKAGTRFGPVVSDEDATIRAGQLLKGDTTAMIRLSPESRDKVLDKVKDLVMPQMIAQYAQEEGHAPDELARKNLLAQVGVQLATGRGEFTGFTQYQRSLAIRQASIDTAIAEAQKVIPIAVAASDSVPRSQFPSWNAIQLAIERGTGGEDVVKLNTATNSLAQIYARAVTPTGQATDLVRQKAYDNLTAAYSQGQYKAAVSIMQLEMDAAQAAPEQVRQQRREEFLRSGVFADSTTPFLQHGVGGAQRTQTAPAATPAWATGSATGPNNEQIYTDGKAWFHADHTPVQ